jgi:hypothetical protein
MESSGLLASVIAVLVNQDRPIRTNGCILLAPGLKMWIDSKLSPREFRFELRELHQVGEQRCDFLSCL